MKKNIFTDNQKSKSSKGFYAALGISVLMIGSACWFAYSENEKNQGDDLTANQQSEVSDAAVDKKYTDLPKITFAYTSPPPTRTQTTYAEVTAVEHIDTVPAAVIENPTSTETVTEENPDDVSQKMSNIYAPLADMSNVINPFSGNELVKNETTGSWQTHNGTDISADISTEVYSMSEGEVTAVNNDPLWGTTVVIDHHNGYITKYCGLAPDLSVQAGDVVASGQTIGAVGNTADIESALDPHLHIEVTHNGEFIDPLSLLE